MDGAIRHPAQNEHGAPSPVEDEGTTSLDSQASTSTRRGNLRQGGGFRTPSSTTSDSDTERRTAELTNLHLQIAKKVLRPASPSPRDNALPNPPPDGIRVRGIGIPVLKHMPQPRPSPPVNVRATTSTAPLGGLNLNFSRSRPLLYLPLPLARPQPVRRALGAIDGFLLRRGLDIRDLQLFPVFFAVSPLLGMLLGLIIRSSSDPTTPPLGYFQTLWLGTPGALIIRLIQVMAVIFAALSAFESLVAAKRLGIAKRGRIGLLFICCGLMLLVGVLALATSAFCVTVIKPDVWYRDLIESKDVSCLYTNINLTRSYKDLFVGYRLQALDPAKTSTPTSLPSIFSNLAAFNISGPYTMPDLVVRPPLLASPSFAPLTRSPISTAEELASSYGLRSVLLMAAPLHPSGALDSPAVRSNSEPLVSLLGLVVMGFLIGSALATSKPWSAVPISFLHGATKLIHTMLRQLQFVFMVTVPFYYAAQHTGTCDPEVITSPGLILMCTTLLSGLLLMGILLPALFILVTRVNFFREMKALVWANPLASLYAVAYGSSTAANSVVSDRPFDAAAADAKPASAPGGPRASAPLQAVVVDPTSRGPTPRPSRAPQIPPPPPVPLLPAPPAAQHSTYMPGSGAGLAAPSGQGLVRNSLRNAPAASSAPLDPSRSTSSSPPLALPSSGPSPRYSAALRPSAAATISVNPGSNRISLTPLIRANGKPLRAEIIGPARVVHSMVTAVSSVLNFAGVLTYEAIAAYCIARVSPSHRNISFFTVAGACCLVSLASCGTGLPCTALPVIITVLKILGVNQSRGEVGTLLAFDFFLDRLKALLNVWVDLAITRCIALAVRGTTPQGLAVLSPETFQALGMPPAPLPRLSVIPSGALHLNNHAGAANGTASARPSRVIYPIRPSNAANALGPGPGHAPPNSARQQSIRFDLGPNGALAPPQRANTAGAPLDVGLPLVTSVPPLPIPIGVPNPEATLAMNGSLEPTVSLARSTAGTVGRISLAPPPLNFAGHVFGFDSQPQGPGPSGGTPKSQARPASAAPSPSRGSHGPGTPTVRARSISHRSQLNIIPEAPMTSTGEIPEADVSSPSSQRRHTSSVPRVPSDREFLLGEVGATTIPLSSSDPDINAVEDITLALGGLEGTTASLKRSTRGSRRAPSSRSSRKAAKSADQWRYLLNQEGPPTPPTDSDMEAMPLRVRPGLPRTNVEAISFRRAGSNPGGREPPSRRELLPGSRPSSPGHKASSAPSTYAGGDGIRVSPLNSEGKPDPMGFDPWATATHGHGPSPHPPGAYRAVQYARGGNGHTSSSTQSLSTGSSPSTTPSRNGHPRDFTGPDISQVVYTSLPSYYSQRGGQASVVNPGPSREALAYAPVQSRGKEERLPSVYGGRESSKVAKSAKRPGFMELFH